MVTAAPITLISPGGMDHFCCAEACYDLLFPITITYPCVLVICSIQSSGNARSALGLDSNVIAATLLLAGGLDALQNVITSLGLPFCFLLVFMTVALFRALRADSRGYSMNELVQGRAFLK
jgi:choline-glycine betaine transporter